MHMDDMILVSIDDHMIEPPDMYEKHVPKKWLDEAPESSTIRASTSGYSRARRPVPRSGWPPPWAGRGGVGLQPGAYSELRPGCFDVHERVRDMNANGVLGSMYFPTMAGWNARTFAESSDKEIALVMLQAYNDWAIDEWCGTYPGRFIPLGIVPMWDVDSAGRDPPHRQARAAARSASSRRPTYRGSRASCPATGTR